MLQEDTDNRHLRSRVRQADDDGVPAAITDTGCERTLNEDRYAVIESASGLAWLVFDGMGGEAGGELAAQLALDAIRRDLESFPARPPEAALKSAILQANRIIVLRRQNPAFAGMGTTVVGALFQRAEVVLGHVGDSRAYIVRDGAIQQVTVDHTYVQTLVDAGQIRPEDALSHPQAHVLTRAIGSEPGLEVSLQKFWIWQVSPEEPGDFLVLCTDGLYSLISEGEIESAVSQNAPQGACARLVELAKSRGGFDNITLAIIPIPGQLRKEPPMGYHSELAAKASRSRSAQTDAGADMFRFFRDVMVLSLLAVLFTIIVMGFWIAG